MPKSGAPYCAKYLILTVAGCLFCASALVVLLRLLFHSAIGQRFLEWTAAVLPS